MNTITSDFTPTEEQSQLIGEVKRAFADCVGEYPEDQRCLAFLTSGWFAADQALHAALAEIGSYNNFDAGRITRHLPTLQSLPGGIRVAVGRSYSPVLYIECDDGESILSTIRPHIGDEHSIVNNPDGVGAVRRHQMRKEKFGHAPGSPHDRCNHAEPVVPDDEIALPDPSREVVSVCWD